MLPWAPEAKSGQLENLIKCSCRAAMIVAHPDDESLWGAGIVIRYPKDWTIFCCTVPFHDPVRAEKFKDACRVLGAVPIASNLSERGGPIEIPKLDEYDLVVTHNSIGEYGHVQHMELHNAIKSRWPDKTICFGYGSQAAPQLVIELTDEERARKLAAIKSYDHVSPTDHGNPKWRALLNVFDHKYDLWREPYE